MIKNFLFFFFQIILILVYWIPLRAQNYPKDYFRVPLDIPMKLSGSFGELRPNHFHSGIDLKTNSVEGLPVYAAADGWIVRISSMPRGYGNCLYINHPNGYTTVYAHLQQFAPRITKYLRQVQYSSQRFEQDIFPDSQLFFFKKGDLIGYSGNTGSSMAPHLHFEIRETISENAINPLLFYTEFKDNIAPIIKFIRIYPLDSQSVITSKVHGKLITATKGNHITLTCRAINKDTYQLSNTQGIFAKGKFGIAIRTIDHFTDYSSTVAPYSIEMCVKGDKYFCQNLERLSFAKQRYINAHTDFEDYQRNKRWFERSYLLDNDSSTIYTVKKAEGKVDITTDTTLISYEVYDLKRNTAYLEFNIKKMDDSSAQALLTPNKIKSNFEALLPFNKDINIQKPGLFAHITKFTFYENTPFTYSFTPKRGANYSGTHSIESKYTPIQKGFLVKLKVENYPVGKEDKLCLINSQLGYIPCSFKEGWVEGVAKSFGRFWVTVDSTPPALMPLNFKNGFQFLYKSIRAKMTDDISGIESYNGYIDNEWVLFQYDAKRNLIYYDIDRVFGKGEHTLKFIIKDRKSNIQEKSFKLYF